MVAALNAFREALLRYAAPEAPGGQAFRAATTGVDLTHSYPWERQHDGKDTIKKLDVFRECDRLNPHTGEMDAFDLQWMERAAQIHSE